MLENILNSILHNLAPLKCTDGNLCPTSLSGGKVHKKCSSFSERERGENTQTTTPNNIINYFLVG